MLADVNRLAVALGYIVKICTTARADRCDSAVARPDMNYSADVIQLLGSKLCRICGRTTRAASLKRKRQAGFG